MKRRAQRLYAWDPEHKPIKAWAIQYRSHCGALLKCWRYRATAGCWRYVHGDPPYDILTFATRSLARAALKRLKAKKLFALRAKHDIRVVAVSIVTKAVQR